MINNYNELQEVKKELQKRVHKTEQNYLQQHEKIAYYLDITGIYKGNKNEENKKNIHSLIIQSISEYLEENKIFKNYNKEYTTFLIPLALTLISAFFIKKL